MSLVSQINQFLTELLMKKSPNKLVKKELSKDAMLQALMNKKQVDVAFKQLAYGDTPNQRLYEGEVDRNLRDAMYGEGDIIYQFL